MNALIIKDHIYWSDDWSSEIGRQLAIHDSSEGLFIFERQVGKEAILNVLQGVPRDLYRLLELEEAGGENCDILADSGLCYRQLH